MTLGVSPAVSRTRRQTVDVVFGAMPVEGRWRLATALSLALAVHGSLWFWARRFEGKADAPPLALVQSQTTVDLTEPPSPLKIPVTTAPLTQPTVARARAVRPRAERAAPPTPASRAAAIIAPETTAPVDLTGETVVIGSGKTFAGGVTAATGTNSLAGQTRGTEEGTPSGAPTGARDLSRPISLESQNWSCPWPHEADDAQIDEQIVVIRVLVAADGHAESADVISDPGRGFGASATSCALRTRFGPARDQHGDPVRARSPPIRVTFTRGSSEATRR